MTQRAQRQLAAGRLTVHIVFPLAAGAAHQRRLSEHLFECRTIHTLFHLSLRAAPLFSRAPGVFIHCSACREETTPLRALVRCSQHNAAHANSPDHGRHRRGCAVRGRVICRALRDEPPAGGAPAGGACTRVSSPVAAVRLAHSSFDARRARLARWQPRGASCSGWSTTTARRHGRRLDCVTLGSIRWPARTRSRCSTRCASAAGCAHERACLAA